MNTADSMVNIRLNESHQQFSAFIKILNNAPKQWWAAIEHRSHAGRNKYQTGKVPAADAMWPASMLANKRIIKANGLVRIPINSMKGIMGTGTLGHQGTSGPEYLFPVSTRTKNVHNHEGKQCQHHGNGNVARYGATGKRKESVPWGLLMKMKKKNAVSR